MKKYEAPKMEITLLDSSDIITTSPTTDGVGVFGEEPQT